ncbi:jg5322 [Pararge aegeria aegeria]|uniref:Jg5322 protein n=1 Tax=Pararge aegeria aegeria TaxID=348720 RepID=A0A8S4RB16_9NEOP|nr:jg5322 [Pararge aegeria aegeria]
MRADVVIKYLTFLAYTNDAYGSRILGLFPHTGKSHQMVFKPLLRKLAENGHHVTVGSFFPLKDPPANYVDISFEGTADVRLESFDLDWYENGGIINKIPKLRSILILMAEFNLLSNLAVDICSRVINLPSLNEALKEEYDVVLVENFNSDCMFGLLHMHGVKAPVIGLSSCVLMPWSAERMGVSDNPSYVPVVATALTPTMTLLERMENTFWRTYFKLWFRYSVQAEEQALIEKAFGRHIPAFANLGRNISLMLVNTYHALNGATPHVPGLVEVGGMHLNHTKKHIPLITGQALGNVTKAAKHVLVAQFGEPGINT